MGKKSIKRRSRLELVLGKRATDCTQHGIHLSALFTPPTPFFFFFFFFFFFVCSRTYRDLKTAASFYRVEVHRCLSRFGRCTRDDDAIAAIVILIIRGVRQMIYDAHVVHAGRFRKYVLRLFFLISFLSHGQHAVSRGGPGSRLIIFARL